MTPRSAPPAPDPPRRPSHRTSSPRDPYVERAREDAEGVEIYEDPFAAETVQVEREEAEGVEVFADPDAVIPIEALTEGAPGHETYEGDRAGLSRDGDEEHERATD